MDEEESKNQELISKNTETEKSADENDQARKILENRGKSDQSKAERLQAELDDILGFIQNIEKEYNEVKSKGFGFYV